MPLPGDGYVAAMGKRLGEDRFFFGAFGVFYYISAIFCLFCLVEMIYFVYLHIVKGVSISFHPEPIIFKKT